MCQSWQAVCSWGSVKPIESGAMRPSTVWLNGFTRAGPPGLGVAGREGRLTLRTGPQAAHHQPGPGGRLAAELPVRRIAVPRPHHAPRAIGGVEVRTVDCEDAEADDVAAFRGNG